MKDLGNFTITKFHLGPKSMEKTTIFTQLQVAILGSFLWKNRACASNTFRATQKQPLSISSSSLAAEHEDRFSRLRPEMASANR